ncbi:MAG: hypothetical protein LBS87_00155 [Puniceicoccales bacterium]|jgi:hypothetical protein|nr:hypothetical protein [Puniceicoccales bacterium]
MENFESSCRKFIKQPGFWLKILVGVLLGAIPGINFLSFGYMGRAVKENGQNGSFFLPHWDLSLQNLKQNFLTGVNGVVILLVFLGGPVIVGYMVGLGLFWISDSMRLLLAYFGLFIGAPTAAYAMLYIADLNELASVRVLWSMFSRTINTCKHVLIPSFLFLCLIILSVQLLPLAMLGAPIFFGLIFVVAFLRNLKIIHE